ncbi:flavonol sulfotransferase-like [Cornus florida]|uniref:flavonol sulfotransferase-like n=1 Tax=Cornus florida TaxID=4283 RepID=UPI00289E709F|nr:flavonol sulfotransferase-like [Cornus florida]
MESPNPFESCHLSETSTGINEKAQQMYTEIIPSLPEDHDWSHLDPFRFYQYQSFWYPGYFLKGVIVAQKHFKAQPADIIVASTPKSGTTWLKALTYAIVTRSQYGSQEVNPLLVTLPHDCVPFLELDILQNPTDHHDDPKLPLRATHIPYTSLPASITSAGCKIVYIYRDPKDVFVSFWCFLAEGKDTEISLEETFDQFCKGVSGFGPYWDHVLGYWKASLEMPERVLFLKYEEMKKETLFHVKQLAQFMGYPFSSEEESQGAVKKIIDLCSFENLSNLEVNKTGKHNEHTPFAIENKAFFRKGKVGDWKNHLTAEMIHRIDQITAQKLHGTGLTYIAHQS